MKTMGTAQDLPNTKKPKGAVFVRSASGIGKVVRAGKYATIADDNGAIGAWIDDAGQYRCEAHRRLVTIDSQIFTSLKAVANWWRDWLKKIA